MKFTHMIAAVLLSLSSAVIAAEPVAAMPVTQAPAAVSEKTDVVQVRHRDNRRHWRHGWRHERPHWRPWRAERRHWREQRYWRHHHRHYHPRRHGVSLRVYL